MTDTSTRCLALPLPVKVLLELEKLITAPNFPASEIARLRRVMLPTHHECLLPLRHRQAMGKSE
jgi:hypothetical protein